MALERQTGNFAAAYEKAKSSPATARDLLRERIEQGVSSDVCYSGAWTNENFNCIQENIYGALAEFNPLIPYAQEAVDAHKTGKEFYLTPDVLLNGKPATEVILEIAGQDETKPAYRARVINLGKTRTHDVPTDSFADDKGILFLARSKKLAKEYGLFLRNKAGIQEVTFYLPSIQSKDFARGFWLSSVGRGDGSDFYGSDRDIDDDDGSVFRVSGRGCKGAQKNFSVERKVLPYTQEQLDSAVQELAGLEKMLLPELFKSLKPLVLGLSKQ